MREVAIGVCLWRKDLKYLLCSKMGTEFTHRSKYGMSTIPC